MLSVFNLFAAFFLGYLVKMYVNESMLRREYKKGVKDAHRSAFAAKERAEISTWETTKDHYYTTVVIRREDD